MKLWDYVGLFMFFSFQMTWMIYLTWALRDARRDLERVEHWSGETLRDQARNERDLRELGEKANEAHRAVFYADGILDRLGVVYMGFDVRETKRVNLAPKKKSK